jgi:triacylglycerol lipase
MFRSMAPRRKLLALGAALLLAAAVAVAGLVASRSGPAAPAPPAGVPVLLVPGYGGAPSSLATLAARLRAAGRRVEVVALPDQGTGDLDASARALGRAVDALRAARVDLVGYSAGGVVVRELLADPARVARARHVVLLGTPNHGAEVAGLAAALDPRLCTGACAQLVPGSAFLARLNRGDETPPGPDWTSIWTGDDQTVTPPASAVLAGARNVRLQDVCAGAGVGHGGLVRDPLAFGLVERALDGALPPRPGPPDCAVLRAAGAAGAAEAGG